MLLKGNTVKQYSVQKNIGYGGTATVYLVMDVTDEKLYAMKEELVGSSVSNSKERLLQEGNLLVGLNHPNVVKGKEVFEQDGKVYIIMEYINGLTLEKILRREMKLSTKTALKIFLKILDGLQEIHSKMVLHRDLTPDNIMITNEGVIKIMDLGAVLTADNNEFTRVGAAIGKYTWMAPEQLVNNDGPRASIKSDIYSAGLILYKMLTGVLPFTGTYKSVITEQSIRQATPVNEIDFKINKRISNFIAKAIDMKPENRFDSVQEMNEVLKDIIANPDSTGDDKKDKKKLFWRKK